MAGRKLGSKNKATLRAMHEVQAARRKLKRLFGDDMTVGGVPMTTALVLTELTRSIYEPQVRLGAAKELSTLEYPRMQAVKVNASGEPIDEAAANDSMQVELWDDSPEACA